MKNYLKTLLIGFLLTAPFACASDEGEKKVTTALSQEEQKQQHATVPAGYRKDLVELILAKGFATGQDNLQVFDDGTTLPRKGKNDFCIVTYCGCTIDTQFLNGQLLDYMCKHNDHASVQKFFATKRVFGEDSSPINRSLNHACTHNNSTLALCILEHTFDEHLKEYGDVLYKAARNFKQQPQLLRDIVAYIKEKHPTDWRMYLGQGLTCIDKRDYLEQYEPSPDRRLSAFTYLLEQGATIPTNLLSSYVGSTVAESLEHPYMQFVDVLMQHNADPFAQPKNGKAAVARLAIQGKHKDTIRALRKRFFAERPKLIAQCIGTHEALGTIVCQYAINDDQDILDATEDGNTKKVMHLLDNGYDANTMNTNFKTCLMYAAERGDEDSVEALLKARADTQLKDNHGFNPLMFAAEQGNTTIAQQICESTPENLRSHMINAQSTFTNRSLDRRRRQADARPRYRAPVEAGAGVYEDVRDDVAGTTPLMLAAKNGKAEVVALLLQLGADATIKNNDGKTAFDIAKDNKHDAVAKLLCI